MRVGSLFSGAGGFDLGFHAAGFTPAFFCEIDPTARAVLARHWPEVPCYEDIRQLDPATLPRVDCLIGGPPCQDFSVAGKRAGLAGERSGLFWEFLRVVAGVRPRWVVAENVPGLLSQNGGRDLGAILGELGRLGYGWTYRVLDAQHWGVPQRRRRVFIVGRAGADARRAASVLFESDRGGGDSPPGSQAGEGAAGCATAGAGSSSSRVGQGWNTTYITGPVGGGAYGSGRRSEDDPNLVVVPFEHGQGDPNAGQPGDPAYALNAVRPPSIASTVQARAGHHGHGSPRGDGNDNLVVAHCLNGSQERLDGPVETFVLDDPPLHAGEEGRATPLPTVRRLLPVETEALQGWPRDWTRWTADGKELADSPRYRLIGNGVAAPVARWLAERILMVERAS